MSRARHGAAWSEADLVGRRALLFDLDGTLVDSGRAHALAFASVVEAHSVVLERVFDYETVRGLDTPSAWRQLGVEGPERVAALTRAKRARYIELVAAGAVDAAPGALELCTELRARHKVVVVVTNASRDGAHGVLAATGLAPLVHGVVSADDVDRPKPSPEPFLEALRRFALDPEQCLAVEDAPEALPAARGAGLEVVLVHRRKGPAAVRCFATLGELGRALIPHLALAR